MLIYKWYVDIEYLILIMLKWVRYVNIEMACWYRNYIGLKVAMLI